MAQLDRDISIITYGKIINKNIKITNKKVYIPLWNWELCSCYFIYVSKFSTAKFSLEYMENISLR